MVALSIGVVILLGMPYMTIVHALIASIVCLLIGFLLGARRAFSVVRFNYRAGASAYRRGDGIYSSGSEDDGPAGWAFRAGWVASKGQKQGHSK